MRRFHLSFLKYSFIVIALTVLSACNREGGLQHVDPDIGGVGLLLQPTRPAVHQPNQFIRVYPSRRDYLDDQIRSFPLALVSHRNGELFNIMPFTGEVSSAAPVSAWDTHLETIRPYYLKTWLETYNTTVEFTPGRKAGFFRFIYPSTGEPALYLLPLRNGKWIKESDMSISAVDSLSGMKVFLSGSFDTPFELTELQGPGRKRYVARFPGKDNDKVQFKYAVSFISSGEAEKNLSAEVPSWDFDALMDGAMSEWEQVFSKISVEGGSEQHKRTFYTALYRCYERMVDVSEGNRYYSNYDGRIHESEDPFYVDDWVWDTYLAAHPLRCILDPELEAEMLRSYIRMYEQSGWMPTFPILWGDNPCMNGFHSTIIFLDAYRKGIRDFDFQTAYAGARKNAVEATMLPWRNGPACSLDTFYYNKGWYPALHPGETETVPLVHSFEKRQSVAVTLGHSYDDWALAEMASELGKEEDYQLFYKRSFNYRNLWRDEKGFFMPKDKDGNWIDIDPVFDGGMGGRDYYDENNGWTYMWQVQHDLPGLIDLMGGKEPFEKKLDRLFTEPLGRSKYETWAKFPDFSGIVGQFSMGNEPSFHIPYLYNLTGSPWKTQKRVRMMLDTWFPDNIFGIPGDEDGGGMSAFVVFSAMGFYPLVPGLPVYTIGSPLFDRITINLPDGKKFTITARGASGGKKYIQNARLNGKVLENPWFTHDELMKGGSLELNMGSYPSQTWGKESYDAFITLITGNK